MRRRRAKRSRSSSFSFARLMLAANLLVALLLGGWYLAQPPARQQEVRRLVETALDRRKQVSAFDIAWDIWQLYYANPATGQIAAGDKTHIYAGTPRVTAGSNATLLRVLVNRGYVVGYDDARANPAWAAYRVRDLDSPPSSPPRPDKFAVDRRTAARVAPEDYTGSGYDRGHMAPNYAIATRYGPEAQEETFLMSNITPQRHTLNAGLWKDLEQKIASSYAARYEEIWVLTGPIFGDRPRTLRGGVQIPEAFWLVIVDEHEGKLRTLSFIVPQDVPAGADPADYLASIDEIEARTQLDLLHELDDPSEAAIEQLRPPRVW